MKRSTNRIWITQVVPAAGGSRLKVTFRDGEASWAARAPDCWVMKLPGFEPVTCSPYSKVRRGALSSETGAVYLKKFLLRGWRDAFKGMFRTSRAGRAWRGDLLMEKSGFSAPHVRCLIRPAGFFRSESMLITDEVSNAVSVKKRLMDPQYGLAAGTSRRFAFLRAVAEAAARLHAAGICHGDLRTNNILSRETGEGWEFIWLDNERNRKYRTLPRRKRNHNLMQFNTDREPSLADRVCFWRAYARAAGLTGDDRIGTARWIRNRTRERWIRHGIMK